MLRFIHIKMSTDLCEIEEIGDHLHESEHADTGGDNGDTAVHVIIGGHLFLLDIDEPDQELVPPVHLMS